MEHSPSLDGPVGFARAARRELEGLAANVEGFATVEACLDAVIAAKALYERTLTAQDGMDMGNNSDDGAYLYQARQAVKIAADAVERCAMVRMLQLRAEAVGRAA